MLEIQKFLRNAQLKYTPPEYYISSIVPNTLKEIEDKYSINVVRSKKYPSLYLFKYNQIKSPFNEKIVRESRGLILDSEDNWSVVSYPFDKFFNLGEKKHLQKDFNWDNYKVFNKLDGSLICLYYYANQWNISTSGNPDASGSITDSKTFFDIAYPFYKDILYYQTLDTNCTYMYELITEYNKNVVEYGDLDYYGLNLIGIRNNKTLQEYDISPYLIEGSVVKYYVDTGGCSNTLQKPRDIFTHYPDEYWRMLGDECKYEWKKVNNLKGNECEGYVLVDDSFNRIKVKSEQYVILHHLKSSWSLSKAIDIVKRGEVDEVSTYLREYRQELHDLEMWLYCRISDLKDLWNVVAASYTSRKDLAIKINSYRDSYPFIGALFAKLDGIEIKDYIYSLPNEKIKKAYEDYQVRLSDR